MGVYNPLQDADTIILTWINRIIQAMSKILCSLCIIQRLENLKGRIILSLSFTIPFYIIHLDIWSPGSALHTNQEVFHLLNTMCYLTQFVLLYIMTYTKVEALAKFLMEEVMLLFCMVAAVVFWIKV